MTDRMKDTPFLHIDTVGFTRYESLTERREVAREIQALLARAGRPDIFGVVAVAAKWKRHGTGDGYYCPFDAIPVYAVLQYALYIQEELDTYNAQYAETLPIKLRAVLGFGDIELEIDQYVSDSYSETARIIDSPEFKQHRERKDDSMVIAATKTFKHHFDTSLDTVTDAFNDLKNRRWTRFEIRDSKGVDRTGYILGDEWLGIELPTNADNITNSKIQESLLFDKNFSILKESAQITESESRKPFETESFSKEPSVFIAVHPNDIFLYLCENGCLSIIENKYIPIEIIDLDNPHGAINRIYCGKANCGKTRAAVEWIKEKIGVDCNQWIILHPETIASSTSKTEYRIDWGSRFGERRRKPQNAILFIDDIPDHFIYSDRTDSMPFQTLIDGIRKENGFKEFWFVGTIRSERISNKKEMINKLNRNSKDICLLQVGEIGEKQRRELWMGMDHAYSDTGKEIKSLDLTLDFSFIEAVSKHITDPETIAYFIRAITEKGKKRLDKDDEKQFVNDVVKIWINLTWPSLNENYGKAACVFFTLSRFIEAGLRKEYFHLDNPYPSWEYHVIYGPKMLERLGDDPNKYEAIIKQMISDGHAAGVENEWIRPKYDFLLQAPELDIVCQLPNAKWFSTYSDQLTSIGQMKIAYHLTCMGKKFVGDDVTVNWLYGVAQAISMQAKKDENKPSPMFEEAIVLFDEMIRRFGDDETPAVREQVAIALFNKGFTLGQLNRSEKEIATYDDLAARFGDDETPAVMEQVVSALYNKSITLGQLNRPEDAINAYDDIIARFGNDNLPAISEQITASLFNKGITLGQLNRFEEEIATYDKLTARFQNDEKPTVRERVAMGLFNKGLTLSQLNRSNEEIAAYDDLAARFGDDETPAVREKVAAGLFNKCITLYQLNRPKDEIAAYDDLFARFGDDETPEIREQIAKGLVNKGFRLCQLNRPEEAIDACKDLDSRFGDYETPAVREQVAKGLFNKGITLSYFNRPKEEIDTYDDLVARFGDDETPSVREKVAMGLVNKGVILGRLNRIEEAIGAYNDLVARFGVDETPAVRVWVAAGLFNKGVTLCDLNRSDEAIDAYDDLYSRYGDDETPAVREHVAKARDNFGLLLLSLWKKTNDTEYLNQAIQASRKAVELGSKPYNLACALATAKEYDEAFELLGQCLKNKQVAWAHVKDDTDWDDARNDPRYKQLEQEYQ